MIIYFSQPYFRLFRFVLFSSRPGKVDKKKMKLNFVYGSEKNVGGFGPPLVRVCCSATVHSSLMNIYMKSNNKLFALSSF